MVNYSTAGAGQMIVGLGCSRCPIQHQQGRIDAMPHAASLPPIKVQRCTLKPCRSRHAGSSRMLSAVLTKQAGKPCSLWVNMTFDGIFDGTKSAHAVSTSYKSRSLAVIQIPVGRHIAIQTSPITSNHMFRIAGFVVHGWFGSAGQRASTFRTLRRQKRNADGFLRMPSRLPPPGNQPAGCATCPVHWGPARI